jgi:hypothetical protein
MLPIVQAVERLWKSMPDARLIYHISVYHLNVQLLGTRYVYEAPQTTICDARYDQKQKSLHTAKGFATLKLQLRIAERKLYVKGDPAMADSNKPLTRVSATIKEMCNNIAVHTKEQFFKRIS